MPGSDATEPLIFSADETCDVGSDTASRVSDDYHPASSHFTGTVNWVQLDQGFDSHEHLITPEEHFRLAMVRQQRTSALDTIRSPEIRRASTIYSTAITSGKVLWRGVMEPSASPVIAGQWALSDSETINTKTFSSEFRP